MASQTKSNRGFRNDDTVEVKVLLEVLKQHERLRSLSPDWPNSSDS
jgi:hypothetical protein